MSTHSFVTVTRVRVSVRNRSSVFTPAVEVEAGCPPAHSYAVGLPCEITAFVSRTRELEALSLLFTRHRLVTVVGPYGVGKTRLAVRYGWLEHERHVRVVFCDLTAASTAGDLLSILQTGLSHDAGVGGQGEPLFILDNFEQLIACAPIVSQMLSSSPRARFLVTSRERLHLAEEACLQLESLKEDEAIALLTDRAQRLAPDFAVDAANRAAMSSVVSQLDGLPLALEMTAPWLQVLSAADLAARLARGFSLLHDGVPTTRHHASMESAIGWSWDLLSPVEQQFMSQAAVFRGHFTIEDAVSVVALPHDAPPVLTLLRRLRERSLLATHRNPTTHQVDFSMSRGVRQFATARASLGDATLGLDARHRAHLTVIAERFLDQLDGPAAAQGLAGLARIRGDLIWIRDSAAAPPSMISRAIAATSCAQPTPLPQEVSLAAPDAPRPTLTLGPHAEWLAVGSTERVALGRRGPVRQILLGLVETAQNQPDTVLSMDALFELGWPGEHIDVGSAANRVYAALSTLRRLGLAPLILTRREGWLLDPNVRITLAP